MLILGPLEVVDVEVDEVDVGASFCFAAVDG